MSSELDDTKAELERIKSRIKALSNKWIIYGRGNNAKMYWSVAGEAVESLLNDVRCPTSVVVQGQRVYHCDVLVDEYGYHDGPHFNAELEAAWTNERNES